MRFKFVKLLLLIFVIKICCAGEINADNYVTRDKRLVGFKFWSAPVSGIGSCAVACIRVRRCVSFNYNLEDKYCDMNNDSAINHSQYLIRAARVLYSDIADWPPELDPNCYHRPCFMNQVCVPSGVLSNVQTCVQFERTKPSHRDGTTSQTSTPSHTSTRSQTSTPSQTSSRSQTTTMSQTFAASQTSTHSTAGTSGMPSITIARTSTQSSSMSATSEDADCTNKDFGRYPLADCRSYLECAVTGEFRRSCGPGTMFNSATSSCGSLLPDGEDCP